MNREQILEMQRISQRKRRARLRLQSRCTTCGKKVCTGICCKKCLKKSRAGTTRLASDRKKRGLCRCGEKKSPGFQSCSKCRQIRYKESPAIKLRYHERKQEGICVQCGQQAEAGKTKCVKCNKNHREWSLKNTQKRIAAKVCIACGHGPLKTNRLCSKCSEDLKIRAKKIRDSRRKRNVCVHCGKNPLKTQILCSECSEKLNQRSKKYR